MSFWLFKSEPNVISFHSLWDKLPADEEWHGIRNYQARNNMRLMQLGERGFFYHSNIGKEIVGIVEVTRLSAPDSKTESLFRHTEETGLAPSHGDEAISSEAAPNVVSIDAFRKKT